MTFDEFLPFVIPYASGCPDLVAMEHVRRAAREFCERTEIWQVESTPTLTRAGIATYALDLDDGQERVKLVDAWLDSSRLEVVQTRLGQALSRRGYGRFIYLDGPLDMTIFPASPADGQKIVVQMVVKPSLDADEWPDDFAEYVQDISHGAISALARLPKTTWADRQQALDERSLFEDRISTVGIKVSRAHTDRFARRASRFV